MFNELRLKEAVVAQKPLWQVAATGVVGGALIFWFIPIFAVINVIFMMPVAVVNDWVPEVFTQWLFPFALSLWPFFVASCAAGGVLAAARVVSARKRLRPRIFGVRWGLDTLVAALGGLLWGAGASAAYFEVGTAVFVLAALSLGAGCLYAAVWRRLHDLSLYWLCSQDDVDYAQEIKAYLLGNPKFGEFELSEVEVKNGCVNLYGTWPDRIVQGSIENALGRVKEIQGVNFLSKSPPGS